MLYTIKPWVYKELCAKPQYMGKVQRLSLNESTQQAIGCGSAENPNNK